MMTKSKWPKIAATAVSAGVLSLGLSGAFANAAPAPNGYPGYPKYTKHVNLTWWTWVPNFQTEVKIFEHYYPSIHVHALTIPGSEYTKLLTVFAAHHGAPDVAMIEFDYLPQFIQTGGLMNISKFLTPYKSQYPKWVWSEISYNNHGVNGVYGVPEDTGAEGLFYSKSAFKKYHLTVPTTWSQYGSEAIKYHKLTGKPFANFNVTDGAWIQSLLWQGGVIPFHQVNGNTWKINFATPASVRILTFWKKLVAAHAVTDIADWTPTWESDMGHGMWPTWFFSAWFPSEAFDKFISKKSLAQQQLTAALPPQWNPSHPTNSDLGGSTQAVTTQTKHPKAAELFATFINTALPELKHDVASTRFGGGGLYPADLRGTKIPQFHRSFPALEGQKAYSQVFAKASAMVNYRFEYSPWGTYFSNDLSVALEKAFAGKETISAALHSAQNTLDQYARSQGYRVTN